MNKTLSKTNQEDLALKLKNKEKDAFKELVEKYGDNIYYLALRFTKNVDDAEELLQEVFLILFRKIHTFKGKSSLSTWIYAITSNTALTFLKRKNKRPSISMEDAGISDDRLDSILRQGHKQRSQDIKDPIIRQEINTVIYDAIEELPSDYKNIFILKEFDKYPIKKIAKRFNLSQGAVKTRLHRARLNLRHSLRRYFPDFNN